jgi:hypothetical protein
MKKLIAFLMVLFAFSIFVMPTNADKPAGPEEGLAVNVLNEVEITNDTGNSLSVKALRNPVEIPLSGSLSPTDGSDLQFPAFVVPEGKLYVIEDINITASSGSALNYMVKVEDNLDNKWQFGVLGDLFVEDPLTQTRFYQGRTIMNFNENSSITVTAIREFSNTPYTNYTDFTIQLSGYALDLGD